MEAVLSACITGGLALLGIIITNMMSNKAIETKLVTGQAVTDEKIDNLRKSVEKHTSAIEKLPILEVKVNSVGQKVETIEKRVDTLEHRVNTLDRRQA